MAPFLGRWVHKRLRLSLEAGAEASLVGELELGGRRIPARAERVDERVEGTFRTAKRELPFKLVRIAEGLTLSCDGRDYSLRRAEAEPGDAMDRFAGSYLGPLPKSTEGSSDIKAEEAPQLELRPRGGSYEGTLVLAGVRYALKGDAQPGEAGQELRGSLRDPLTGRSLGFSLSRVEEQLLLTVRFEGEDQRVSYETLVFQSR